MLRSFFSVAAACGVLSTTEITAQQPIVLQLNGNGTLQWGDMSSAFVKATSYTIEWASQVQNTNNLWTPLTTIQATQGNYSVPVPMFYRVQANVEANFPKLRLAVLSDTHYFAPSLLIQDGTAFQGYLAQDPKLLAESRAIIEAVTKDLEQAQPQIVLVSGDLTKDGEKVSHQEFATYLQRLKTAGAKVYVCPGNHDINNPDAKSFDGDKTSPVPSIAAGDFASIYANFGYQEAIARDPNSLSYVAEPTPGLWVLSMDSCRYQENTTTPIVGGTFDAGRLAWITNQLAAARAQGKFVIGMMHHGIVEHFAAEEALFADYLLKDYRKVASLFASYGMRLVFTGHYHSQDIVQGPMEAGGLLDVETSSTTMFPCAYRLADLETNGTFRISTHRVTSIDYPLGTAPDFQTYALHFLQPRIQGMVTYMLMMPPYSLPQAQAEFLAPALAEGLIANYQGNEDAAKMTAGTQQVLAYLNSQTDPLAHMITNVLLALFYDPAPIDWNLNVNLLTGGVTE